MSQDQILILAILAAIVAVFIWGRWRHDMVALGALLACVFGGLVPAEGAFAGFGHPAVITVACVLVLSGGLQSSGAADALTRLALPQAAGPIVTTGALTALAAILSAFMNNVGALALLMPVGIQIAAKQGLPPGKILMPLAFGSILGGTTTLIGTPPNLIVAGFRSSTGTDVGSFTMFDFTPVGLVVAVAGVAFVVFLGRRLVPVRARAGAEGFETGAYLTEARVPDKGKVVGMRLGEVEKAIEAADAQVVGLVRDEIRIPAPSAMRLIRAGDILVVEAEPEALAGVLSGLGLKLAEAEQKPEKVMAADADENEEAGGSADAGGAAAIGRSPDDRKASAVAKAEAAEKTVVPGDDIVLAEIAVLPNSDLVGRSATDIRLRTRFGINLLAISRQGRRSIARLRTTRIVAGDVLLMQGAPESLNDFASHFGCVPLAERSLRIPDRRRALLASGIMAGAIAGAAFGLLPAAITFAAGVLAAMAARVVSTRNVYDAIDWPVVVLLGALIPVAGAMETTGAADLVARLLLDMVAQGNAVAGLTVILVVTMILSGFMNNAATAAVMCPIAIGTAGRLEASADPFLMAVAVGASCAFLTPIGHQNNTLILGPGGFRFGDYWRLGLPLSILITAVSVPMILLVWPL